MEDLKQKTPVYGDFSILHQMHLKQVSDVPAVTTVPYNCGYYDHRTGQYSPVPVPQP